MVSDSDFGLYADFYGEIVIAAGNTGLSGKGAAIGAPRYHKKERSSDDWRGSRPKFRSRAGCSLLFLLFLKKVLTSCDGRFITCPFQIKKRQITGGF